MLCAWLVPVTLSHGRGQGEGDYTDALIPVPSPGGRREKCEYIRKLLRGRSYSSDPFKFNLSIGRAGFNQFYHRR